MSLRSYFTWLGTGVVVDFGLQTGADFSYAQSIKIHAQPTFARNVLSCLCKKEREREEKKKGCSHYGGA